ncbi:MAG: MFS transporter, partial [Planctomycetes bacterium]|nr:MFS transporter [Planctomycetota bacterium]
SSAIGPLVFGAISSGTGSRRVAIGFTAAFFVAGIIGMFFVNEKAGRSAAEEFERELGRG